MESRIWRFIIGRRLQFIYILIRADSQVRIALWIPFKSTRNSSRRSSILKPPKPRHPLQNLNFSSSSNENSPTTTTKIKRRVSFAEKKHVKEFCNSLEQGTVWNNTYEENDLSNLKIPCSSNQKECEIESIFKENFFDNHENDAQSDYNKVMEENVNSKEDSLHVINVVKNVNCQDEMLMTEPLITLHDAVVEENKSISLTNLQLDNDNHISKSITVDEIIWEIYHENIEKNMFIAGFISCSLLVVIFIRDLRDVTNNEFIKDIKLISRLADDADVLMNIVHRIILEKLDVKKLLDLYKNREDILLMLDFISKEVKLAMDFMFELKCLNDLNLMEITRDRISFVSQTRTGNIILEITIDIKPFDKIEPRNISIHCLMGSVRSVSKVFDGRYKV
ncbi:hypothetical protein E2986_00182 [Frieseomelitta varia]|uniref:Uncharacterized protein n=1 Tax=Frieseomelitta varia TaxID=561572 RepID=A0A833S8L3_9HYME|nr:hypothetical protein E2986_00182 [Frieseomelitta varia]